MSADEPNLPTHTTLSPPPLSPCHPSPCYPHPITLIYYHTTTLISQVFTKRSMSADEPMGSLRVSGAALATWLQRQENSAFPIQGLGPGPAQGQGLGKAGAPSHGNMLIYGSFTPPPRPETALTPDLLATHATGGGGGRQSLEDDDETTKYELAIFQACNIPEKHEKKEEKEKDEKRGVGGGGMFSGFVNAFSGRSEKKEDHHEVIRPTHPPSDTSY